MEELLILGRMAEKDRLKDRRLWMVLGVLLCSVLLVGIGWLVKNGENGRFAVAGNGFNMRNGILFFGGSYLLYKAVKEIHHKPEGPDTSGSLKKDKPQSFWALMAQIIIIDAVFSFDSIITVIGQAKHVEIMIAAVIIAMVVMFFFTDGISGFTEQHPALKMLALSFLVMVGFMLFREGLEPEHHGMIPKGYAAVAMAFAFSVELLNMRASCNKGVELRK